MTAHAERPTELAANTNGNGRTLLRRLRNWPLSRVNSILNAANDVLMGLPNPAPSPRALTLVRWSGSLCAEFVHQGVQPAWQLRGPDWSVVFVGEAHGMREIRRLLFDEDDPVEETRLPGVAPWHLAGRAHSWLGRSADLIIVEHYRKGTPYRLHAPLVFDVPTWVDQCLDLPESLDDLIKGKRNASRRSLLNQCVNAGAESRFSHSGEDLRRFYDEMYLPFIRERHGERTLATSYARIERIFRAGGLAVVELDGSPIAGKVCYLSEGVWNHCDLGVAVDHPGFSGKLKNRLRRGITVVLDWHCLQMAHERGARTVNWGGTRGWASDGIFWYKSSWGARAKAHRSIRPRWSFLSAQLPPGLRDRINEIGFISEVDGKHVTVEIADTAAEILRELDGERRETLARRGLDGLMVLSPGRPAEVLDTDASPV